MTQQIRKHYYWSRSYIKVRQE